MPRTAIPITEVPFQGKLDNISFTAADATNQMMFDNDGSTVLVVKNTSGAAVTVTVLSVKDEAGRSGDLSISVPATTGLAFIGPLRQAWWNQTATDIGKVYVNFSSGTGVSIAALRIRG